MKPYGTSGPGSVVGSGSQEQLVVPRHSHSRRRSSMLDVMGPGQLYITESGRLYHAGRIAIIMVGLPARGKTHLSVALGRYLRWLGVKCKVFHLGDYRRNALRGAPLPEDYFSDTPSNATRNVKAEIIQTVQSDMFFYLNSENGQVVIYDAVNPTAKHRREWRDLFMKQSVQTLFIESFCDDQEIIRKNVLSVKISSPDYVGWDAEDAVKNYLDRINHKLWMFESIEEKDLSYLKMININQRLVVNNAKGYLTTRVVYYLMNLHTLNRCLYFARSGQCDFPSYKADSELSQIGREYSNTLAESLLNHRAEELREAKLRGEEGIRPLTVWTSTRRRTIQTAGPFADLKYVIRPRQQLTQINPGVLDQLSKEEMLVLYPDEMAMHRKDAYHHRYPRGESYQDLAVRLEPIMMEMERETNDLLIIAHESVLRVLYAYFMGSGTDEIPYLQFERSEIVEVIPSSYNCQVRKIPVVDRPPS